MSKRLLYALLLIGLTVVVLLFNTGKVNVHLLVVEFSMLKPLAFLSFSVIGVVIGVLVK